MKEVLEKIAKKAGASLYFNEALVYKGFGVRDTATNVKIVLDYRNKTVVLTNFLGVGATGLVYCRDLSYNASGEFELVTRSHWETLFFRNRNRFKLNCDHSGIRNFIRTNSAVKTLKNLANEQAFEPRITGKNVAENFHLEMEYHLAFENWWEAILPILKFYKDFIDRHN